MEYKNHGAMSDVYFGFVHHCRYYLESIYIQTLKKKRVAKSRSYLGGKLILEDWGLADYSPSARSVPWYNLRMGFTFVKDLDREEHGELKGRIILHDM